MAEVVIAPNSAPATKAARAAGSKVAVAMTLDPKNGRVDIWCHGDTEAQRVFATALAEVVGKVLEVNEPPEWLSGAVDLILRKDQGHG
ncbi:hypothetical protein [Rhodospirillum sp. A1_3_36]|uniref:hypothetical protein n=1 Tax=Rhodospirillum sp. A1_3_36 TaxID=3391666 RepID=UPI0039A555B0